MDDTIQNKHCMCFHWYVPCLLNCKEVAELMSESYGEREGDVDYERESKVKRVK